MASSCLPGAPTRVFAHRYADRVLLSITQRESFGTLAAVACAAHPDGHVETHVRVLLGDREDEWLLLAATRLGELVLCVRGLGGIAAGGRRDGVGTLNRQQRRPAHQRHHAMVTRSLHPRHGRRSRETQLPLLLTLGPERPLDEAAAKALLVFVEAAKPWAAAPPA